MRPGHQQADALAVDGVRRIRCGQIAARDRHDAVRDAGIHFNQESLDSRFRGNDGE